MTVKARDYIGRLSEHASMKVSVVLKVLETGQVESFQDDFLLRKPEMNIDVRLFIYSDQEQIDEIIVSKNILREKRLKQQ